MKSLDLEQAVEKDIHNVQTVIRNTEVSFGSGKINLYEAVLQTLSDGTRHTKTQIEYLSAFEKALAVFRTGSMELRKVMDTKTLELHLQVETKAVREQQLKSLAVVEDTAKDTTSNLQRKLTRGTMFSNRYALFLAANAGLDFLNEQPEEMESRFDFGPHEGIGNIDVLTPALIGTTVKKYLAIVEDQKELKEDELKNVLKGIFTSWTKQFNWATWKDVAKEFGVEELALKYENYSLSSGEFHRKYSTVIVDDKFMSVRKADVVGNKDHVDKIDNLLTRVLFWNEERRTNPLAGPTAVVVYGNPGGGKTLTAHAIIQSAGDLAREHGIPLLAFQINVSEFGSKYQNETPAKWKELVIDRACNHKGPVILYMADIDTAVPSREAQGSTNEDSKLAGVMLSTLDGSIIPKGKFTLLGDANYLEGMDSAFKNRCIFMELKRYDTPEDFAAYARFYCEKDKDQVGVSEGEWMDIGRYLLSTQLSNREIANVLSDLKGKFDIPTDLLGKPFEEVVRYRQDYMRTITQEQIIGKCQDYIDTRMRVERDSMESKRKKMMERLLIDLETEPQRTDQGAGAV